MSEKVKYYNANELREAFEEKIHFMSDLTEWDVHETLDTVPVHEINGETTDGYHTFNELYHHRAVLFSVICNLFPGRAWKSKLHDTGDMFDGMFIVGIETPQGQATYHYDVDPYWDMFRVPELERAPKWDGHTPEIAIERIGELPDVGLVVVDTDEWRTMNARYV